MRVMFVGGFEERWASESELARDIEAAGDTVERIIEPADPSRAFMWLAELEERAAGADLLIYQKRWGLPAEAVTTWRHIEAAGTRTVSYHLDLYYGLPRQSEIGIDPMWRTGTVFTADGDPNSARWFRSLGIRHEWLPGAIGSDYCYQGKPDPMYEADVAFVGQQRYHPAWPWRAQLLDALGRRYGRRFRIFGDRTIVRGDRLNDLYATVPVIVGDSLCLQGHRNYWSDRYYQTLGRHGCLVGPRVPGLPFTDGEHLRMYEYGDTEGVCKLVDWLLERPDRRVRLAAQGAEHVAENHTYRNRWAEMCARIL